MPFAANCRTGFWAHQLVSGTCLGQIRFRNESICQIHRFPNFSNSQPALYLLYFPFSFIFFILGIFSTDYYLERDTRPLVGGIPIGRPIFVDPVQSIFVINGRVLLIELPTNSVFMRLRRVHFAGLGIAWASTLFWLLGSGSGALGSGFWALGSGLWVLASGFGFGFWGQRKPANWDATAPRQEIVFNLSRCAFWRQCKKINIYVYLGVNIWQSMTRRVAQFQGTSIPHNARLIIFIFVPIWGWISCRQLCQDSRYRGLSGDIPVKIKPGLVSITAN